MLDFIRSAPCDTPANYLGVSDRLQGKIVRKKNVRIASYSMTPIEKSESLEHREERKYLAKLRWRYEHAHGLR